jgi:hypothetical protein
MVELYVIEFVGFDARDSGYWNTYNKRITKCDYCTYFSTEKRAEDELYGILNWYTKGFFKVTKIYKEGIDASP